MQYDLAEFALKMVAPNNKLIYDDKGIPSVMVYVPKLKRDRRRRRQHTLSLYREW